MFLPFIWFSLSNHTAPLETVLLCSSQDIYFCILLHLIFYKHIVANLFLHFTSSIAMVSCWKFSTFLCVFTGICMNLRAYVWHLWAFYKVVWKFCRSNGNFQTRCRAFLNRLWTFFQIVCLSNLENWCKCILQLKCGHI